MIKCEICKEDFPVNETYEYRGAFACHEHFDQVCEKRDYERAEIIREESHKTDRFRGLDLSDSVIGKANKEILKSAIEIASKESGRLRAYEKRK